MSIEKIINEAWEKRDQIIPGSDENLKNTVNQIIDDLDSGKVRVAEKINGEWTTHQYLKKAIMLSFRMYPMENLNGPYSSWYDKAHLLKGKTAGWSKEDHENAGFRMVPNSPVRKGSYVGKNAVLMPCYVNIGAYIDEGTMIDTFARAGSCSQIVSFGSIPNFLTIESKVSASGLGTYPASLISKTLSLPNKSYTPRCVKIFAAWSAEPFVKINFSIFNCLSSSLMILSAFINDKSIS